MTYSTTFMKIILLKDAIEIIVGLKLYIAFMAKAKQNFTQFIRNLRVSFTIYKQTQETLHRKGATYKSSQKH